MEIKISIRNKQLKSIRNSLKKETEILFNNINEELSNESLISELEKINDKLAKEGFSIQQIIEPQNDKNWLGSYSPMSSPGIIQFNKRQILGLSLEILLNNLSLKEYIYRNSDPVKITDTIFLMILHHELFHYFCDLMIYDKSHKDAGFIADEEGLAVACSYLLADNNYYSPHNKFKFKEFFYNRISSAGYRDWKNHVSNEIDFPNNVCSYIRDSSLGQNYFFHNSKSFIDRFKYHFTTVLSKPNVTFQIH
jgi:hypothetical protein